MQALMLAAGMGKRLGKYTADNTKCMLNVQGKTLIERTIESLLEAGVKKLILVVGYKGDNLKRFLLEECDNPRIKEMELVFVENPIYDTTNNIYSLFLAKDSLMEEDTILLESDLIYEKRLIKELVTNKEKNLVAVAKYEQWMDGTVIKIDEDNNIADFIEKKNFDFNDIDEYYKTVNIYKLSKSFSKSEFVPFLESYIKAYGENEYYELVLKIIAHLSRSNLKAFTIGDIKWYEIDDSQDLDIANCLFSEGEERLRYYQQHNGGYWRFATLLDYSNLENAFYPSQKLLNKLNYFVNNLITSYPSVEGIQDINAGRLLDIDSEYLCVGNGLREIMKVLDNVLSKKEYLVNPDNPTGRFIKKDEVLKMISKCQKEDKYFVFDETFIDFADEDIKYTLLNEEILDKYPNLIVVKSISASYGVPGLRLGILATSNTKILTKVKELLPELNTNSLGEYFLQVAPIYKADYLESCKEIVKERKALIKKLETIDGIEAMPSQANYLLCKLTKVDSTSLAIKLLENDVLIKDLKEEKGFAKDNYIRVAIRSREDNEIFIKRLKEALKELS